MLIGCMPCVMMGSIVGEIPEKFKGKIRVIKVNMEYNQKLTQKYNISLIPNFIIFKDKKLLSNLLIQYMNGNLKIN